MADYQAQCSSNQYITLLLWTSVASQDVAGNTTTLSWSLHVKKSSASTSATWGNCSYGVTINGNAYSDSGQVRVEAGGDTTVLSGTTVIPHNADGTKTVNLSASISGKIVGSLSASEALATIARASTMAVYGATIGSQVQFVISAANAGFTHSLEYQFGSATGLILDVVPAGTYTWTPPLSLGSQIPNATSGTMTYKLHTFLSGTVIGVQTYTFPYALPSSVVPSISSVAATEATSGLAAQFGGFVQGKSTLKVTTSASGSYGSTIKSCVISFDGKTYSGTSVTTSAPSKSGSQTITAKVTDTRGRTASKSITVSVLPYAKPAITVLRAWRCTEDGTEDDSGDYVGISYAYSVSSVNSKNTASAKIEYKRSTLSSWTSLLTNSAYSVNTSVHPSAELLSDYRWDIRLTVSDYFGSTTMTITLPSAQVIMDLLAAGDGMGIGRTSEQSKVLAIAWHTLIGSDLEVGGKLSVGNVPVLFGYQSLSSGTADSITLSPGVYLVDASSVSGCPVSSGYGWLVVFPNQRLQQFVVYNTNVTYTRGYTNSQWYGWTCTGGADSVVATGTSGAWSYIKYADGIGICYRRYDFSGANITSASGGIYVSSTVIANSYYPFSFVAPPVEELTVRTGGNRVFLLGVGHNTTTYSGGYALASPVSYSNLAGVGNLFAVGRWK